MKSNICLVKVILFLACAFVFVGCSGEPTFDGSSAEALEKSMQEIHASLSEKQQEELENAIVLVMMDGGVPLGGEETVEQVMFEKLDGKTAEEIITWGRKISEMRQ